MAIQKDALTKVKAAFAQLKLTLNQASDAELEGDLAEAVEIAKRAEKKAVDYIRNASK